MTNSICTVNGISISQTNTSGINVSSGSTITIALVNSSGVSSWSISATQADDVTQSNGNLTAVNNSKVVSGFSATFVVPSIIAGRGASLQFTSTINDGTPTRSSTTFGVFVLNSSGTRLFFGGETNESNATVGNAADLNSLLSASSNANATSIQGVAVSSTAPTDGQVLEYVTSNSDWEPKSIAQTPTGTGYAHITTGVIDGAATDFISVGSTLGAGYHPATVGLIRLPLDSVGDFSAGIMARNSANTANMPILTYTGSLFLGGAGSQTWIEGDLVNLSPGGTTYLQCLSSTINLFKPMVFDQNDAPASISQLNRTVDATVNNFIISAQGALNSASTNINGGSLQLQSGKAKANGSSGLRGAIQLQIGEDTSTGVMVEVAEPAIGQRVVALCQIGSGITTSQMPSLSGDGVIYIANATQAPAANAVGGGILYCQGGALKFRGSSGTITTIASA